MNIIDILCTYIKDQAFQSRDLKSELDNEWGTSIPPDNANWHQCKDINIIFVKSHADKPSKEENERVLLYT